MQDKKDYPEFDLEDILSEFQEKSDEKLDLTGTESLSADLAELLGDWDQKEVPTVPEAVPAAAEDTPEAAEQLEMPPVSEEERDDPLDTIRMNELISQIVEKADPETVVPEGETIRMDALPERETEKEEERTAVSQDATIRVDPVPEKATAATISFVPGEKASAEEAETPSEPNILYNPRTRLRELKKKLVAGPEKRYYELSEIGVGKMQISILINLAIVALCIVTATLYSLEMIPENRLRFVIFSQILAMLLSAFLGCGQMLDGLGDLFKGRFSTNTMLTLTFAACCADAVLCLSELRIPCCAAFVLEMTMSLWAGYQRHATEMSETDTMRKAVRLNALVKEPDYYGGRSGLLRRDGEVEDFMEICGKRSGPEILQSIYCLLSLLLCIGISVYAGMNHGTSMGVQILSTSLLVAVPASFFVTLTRPAALLERRLHMVGTVLCGWKGVKGLCGKAAFPLRDEDLFPPNTTKLNGVKFYGDRDPDEVVSYTASVIFAAGGSLVSAFQKMQESRNCACHDVTNLRDYGSGGIGGEVCGEPVLLGTMDFLQDMGVEIPEGTMVNQAVYAAIDGQLCAVFAISYAKMRSAAAGIVSLCSSRKVMPVMIGSDFMMTDSLLRAKFGINTRRLAFPEMELRKELYIHATEPDATALALATRDDLVSYAYAISGARALRSACNLGMAIHLIGGILGMLIMAALAYLGNTELLTPTHVLLYQLVWMVPGLLITEWTRTV